MLEQLLIYTLCVSVTGVFLLGVKWLFREHMKASWHYGMWAILGIQLVLTPLVWAMDAQMPALDFSIHNLLPAQVVVQQAEQGINQLAAQATGQNLPPQVTVASDEVVGGFVSVQFPDAKILAVQLVGRILWVIYLVGAVAMLVWMLYLALRLKWKAAHMPEAHGELRQRLKRLEYLYELDDLPVVLAPEGNTPYICGMFRPILVIPQHMAQTVDDRVLLHELLHRKHSDIAVSYFFLFFRCVHWFNPLFWFITARISDDCEAACDERVVEQLEAGERMAYGKLLLALAVERFHYRMGTSCIAGGEKQISRRIRSIARWQEISPKCRRLGTAIFWLMLVMCLTGPQVGAATVGWLHSWQAAPGQNLSWELKKADWRGADDLHEALYLYGKAYALDNGYYLYAVADDEQRAQLKQQFTQNKAEGKLLWHFDDTITRSLYAIPLSEKEENETEEEVLSSYHKMSTGFGIYNVAEKDGHATAMVVYPIMQYLQPDSTVRSAYHFDQVEAYEQNGRWVVRQLSREQNEQVDTLWWDDLPGQPAFSYTAEDDIFQYRIDIMTRETYSFYEFNLLDGTWQDDPKVIDPLFGLVATGSGVPGRNLAEGYWIATPKQPLEYPVYTGFVASNEPLDGEYYTYQEMDLYHSFSKVKEGGKEVWGGMDVCAPDGSSHNLDDQGQFHMGGGNEHSMFAYPVERGEPLPDTIYMVIYRTGKVIPLEYHITEIGGERREP